MPSIDPRDAPPAASGGTPGTPDPSGQAPAAPEICHHTVEGGDSLAGIAMRYYGDAGLWPAILEANRWQLDDPDLLRPGQMLLIPGLD